MDQLVIKHRLLDKGLSLIDLARQTGVAYDRLIRVVNGYRKPKPTEVEAIAEALGLSSESVGGDATDTR